jgi:hypothetical protein
VVLLLLNPGYSWIDPEDEAEIDGYADALRAATTLSADGFCPLDPRFKRTSGAYWWRERIPELLQAAGRELVFRRLACVEFFPYHSEKSFSPPHVPSQEFTFDIVRSVLSGSATVVVLRKAAEWKRMIPEILGNPRVIFRPERIRNAAVSRGTLGESNFQSVVRALTS